MPNVSTLRTNTNARSTSVRWVRDIEERFEGLRRSAACAHLSRDQVSDLVAICAELVEERKRIRRSLERLPESFADVRKILNDLARAVR